MSVSLYYGYYPKKCNDPDILPFLAIIESNNGYYNGNHVASEFYESCNRYAEWNKENQCWIFNDARKLFEFATFAGVPVVMSDFIGNEYISDNQVFIIWKR